MNKATILKTPQEIIKDIQNYDRNILIETLLTNPKDLVIQYDFFEKKKNLPGANIDLFNKLQQECLQIMVEKVKLTKTVLGINGNIATIIPNPQLNLNLEDVQEVKESENEEIVKPEEQMAKTEVKDNVIKHDFNKKNKQADLKVINKDVDKVKDQKKEASKDKRFQGYTRKVIFGTATELPKSIQELVPVAKTESEIDAIARHLVEDNRIEDALNLSIDLFEKSDVSKKTQQEVEMRFLNEILPWCYGVTSKPFDNFQNITLAFWNNHLIEIATANQLILDITAQAVEEMKAGQITATTAIKIKTEFPNDSDKIFGDVAKQCGISHVKVESAPVIPAFKVKEKEASKEVESTIGLTFEVLKNECFAKLKAEEKFDDIKLFFEKEVQNVVDEKFDKTNPQLLTNIVAEYWKNKKTVDTAEEAAYKGETTVPEAINNKAKGIIVKCLEAGSSIVNELRKLFSKKENRGVLGKTKIEDYAKKLEEEVKKENPSLTVKSKEKIRLIANLPIETDFPDVWETAKNCKDLKEFKDLLLDIVFEKKQIPMIIKGKTKSIDGWQVAGNLMLQYSGNIAACKDWDDTKKKAFFEGIVNAMAIERKKTAEAKANLESTAETTSEIITDVTPIEETKQSTAAVEEPNKQQEIEEKRAEETQQTTTPATTDMKKFDAISTLTKREKINELVIEFLLLKDHLTYKERFDLLRDKYLKNNKNWSGSKPEQRENTINKIVKDNAEIQELAK